MGLQIRRDSAADWTSENPTLAAGEEGYETDTGKRKVGDGSTAWNSLAYDNATLFDAELAALAGLTSAANKLPYFTGSGTAAVADLSVFARTILDDADEAAFKATVNLEIGTDVQAFDADLSAIAALSPSNDDIVQRKAGAWTNRTVAQYKTDLALNNVDNTSDATKNSATATLTNKRVTPRVGTTASSATPTPDADAHDIYTVTALAEAAAFAAPSGTPTNGQVLIIRIKDNGTARALSFNAIYRAIGATLPTTTVISKTMYLGMIYNSADTKWDVLSVIEEA
jgi:hypothetical protein